jgi:arsenite-transporting ATPase
MSDSEESDFEKEQPSVLNLVERKELKWIFVGGKGGVGKTTTSCSIAVLLAKTRGKVLLISTDPAHNLSDAFNQKFSDQPSQVNGVPNLFAMEVEPKLKLKGDSLGEEEKKSMSLLNEIPGIDEAMSFAEVMKQAQSMDYDVCVFDTAPTGHTLRLVSFPTVLKKAFAQVTKLKDSFGGMFSQATSMLQQSNPEMNEEKMLSTFEQIQSTVESVNEQFRDPDRTTFVCVCIPEFLSLFETERLVQELTKYGIEADNIVVNQVLFPEEGSTCNKCNSRVKMQNKYINQIFTLYDDFHVTLMPLEDEEVRGMDGLVSFGGKLSNVTLQEKLQAKYNVDS